MNTSLFATLPHTIYLTLLSIEDILAFGATSHEMHQLCADNVIWQAIFEDFVDRCRFDYELENHARTSIFQSLRNPQKSYKHKTLKSVLVYLDIKKDLTHERISYIYQRRQDYCNFDRDYASDEELECDPEWGELVDKELVDIDTLEEHKRAIRKTLQME